MCKFLFYIYQVNSSQYIENTANKEFLNKIFESLVMQSKSFAGDAFLQHMPVTLWRRIETPGITLSFMTRLVTKNALANECQWHRGIPQHAFCEDMPRKAIDIHLLRHTIPKLRVMKEGVKENRPH